MLKLISLDIDGTLDVGDPPGPIPIAFVHELLAAGHIVGSCSDNTVSFQKKMWEKAGIVPHFTVIKHGLLEVKSGFAADYYVHVGDRVTDRLAAKSGGFEFIDVAHMTGPNGEQLYAEMLLEARAAE